MQDLIKRCKDRDRDAMGEVYERYKTIVYRTAMLLCQNSAAAEDVTQESFIRLFSKLHLYKPDFPFEAWLYRIVVNVAKNIHRKNRFLSYSKPLEDYCAIEEEGTTPSQHAEMREQKEKMYAIIQTLPYKIKEVIILKYFNCFTQEQISEVLQIPVGTVKSRIHIGLEKIKSEIKRDNSLKEVFNYA